MTKTKKIMKVSKQEKPIRTRTVQRNKKKSWHGREQSPLKELQHTETVRWLFQSCSPHGPRPVSVLIVHGGGRGGFHVAEHQGHNGVESHSGEPTL